MAILPLLEKGILQSRESDADAKMSSSNVSEGDTLKYDMSEDLEDTSENVCPTTPPPPSTTRKRFTIGNCSNEKQRGLLSAAKEIQEGSCRNQKQRGLLSAAEIQEGEYRLILLVQQVVLAEDFVI
ncbi:hypothetical protein AVEN_108001-1 [Araneus ventricosus]|uniref:Uncharacterized protein n=1 Tax=Araneus ventricosus TaxID=182803 RepID=A0A4Y2DRQ3_ARAVE|nr:hypothetical protein AVEN_108001-1 [Araneus ventricosus]